MKIGIFDSGIGGVTVLHEAMKRLPNEEYIFYADLDHVPYGVKTPEEVTHFVDNIVDDLIGRGVDAIVIACNTATSVAAEYVRIKYDIPIIGMEPAVKPAVEAAEAVETKEDGSNREPKRVLVMATPITIRENKLQKLLKKVDKNHIVDLLPMPGLVRFAESGVFDGPEVDEYLTEQLAVFDKSKYAEVVLGCTHFNYFMSAIRKAFADSNNGAAVRDIDLVDGNEGTVKHLAEVLGLEESKGVSTETTKKISDNDEAGEMIYNVSYVESGRDVTDEETLAKYARLHARLDSE
ncbi:glutamate racemase [Lachnospiraceae bacterium NE2001]|nr:glutamate racemase [Lachnospiraceae bacterium NE2001]